MAVWFAGSREGASDVQVRGSRYDPETAEWGDELILATRESTQLATQKCIRKLGNPVIALAPDDTPAVGHDPLTFCPRPEPGDLSL